MEIICVFAILAIMETEQKATVLVSADLLYEENSTQNIMSQRGQLKNCIEIIN